MTRPQRYTGPELSELLREVRSELGERATIHEANRIRTGGIAGFFRSEAFEVLASPSTGPDGRGNFGADPFAGTVFSEDGPLTDAGGETSWFADDDGDDLIAQLTASMQSERQQSERQQSERPQSERLVSSSRRPGVSTLDRPPARRFGPEDLAPAQDLPDPPSDGLHRVADDLDRITAASSGRAGNRPLPITNALLAESMTPGQALLERAESISTEERIDQLLRAARPMGALTPTASVPKPPVPAPPIEAAPAPVTPIAAEHRPPRPTPPILTAPDVVPESSSRPAAVPVPSSEPAMMRSNAGATDFWTELAQLEAELRPATSIDAATQLIVGPLDVALPLARRTLDGRPDAELTVLTDEAALAGIPAWKLAENSRDLLGRLTHWTDEGRRCVGVIEAGGAGWADGDVDAPVLTARLMGVIERVCAGAVVGQLRLALRTLPNLADLADLAGSLNVPLVLDLATAPSPSELDAAIGAGVPISSICGRPLTPALVMALRQR